MLCICSNQPFWFRKREQWNFSFQRWSNEECSIQNIVHQRMQSFLVKEKRWKVNKGHFAWIMSLGHTTKYIFGKSWCLITSVFDYARRWSALGVHWMCLHNSMMQIKSTMNFPHRELELAINAGKCRCRKRNFNWINCTSWTYTKSEGGLKWMQDGKREEWVNGSPVRMWS